jgi:hypothetical protein
VRDGSEHEAFSEVKRTARPRRRGLWEFLFMKGFCFATLTRARPYFITFFLKNIIFTKRLFGKLKKMIIFAFEK